MTNSDVKYKVFGRSGTQNGPAWKRLFCQNEANASKNCSRRARRARPLHVLGRLFLKGAMRPPGIFGNWQILRICSMTPENRAGGGDRKVEGNRGGALPSRVSSLRQSGRPLPSACPMNKFMRPPGIEPGPRDRCAPSAPVLGRLFLKGAWQSRIITVRLRSRFANRKLR